MTSVDYENFYQYMYYGSNFILYFALFLELLFFLILKKSYYDLKSFLCDLGFVFTRALFFALTFGFFQQVLHFAYEFRLFNWQLGYVVRFITLFMLIDFVLYWAHRYMHKNDFLWCIHTPHHSVENLNILSSFRFHFFNIFYDGAIYCVFALLGFHPSEILVIIFFMLSWQSICHTQFDVKLGFLEKIILTPSNHRVHHGTNEKYLNKNYANFFIIWDRLFKTYQPELEPVRYGLVRPFDTANPLKLMFFPMKEYFVALMNSGKLGKGSVYQKENLR